MAAIIVFFALLIFYICFIPVKVALRLEIGEKILFSSGAAVFESRFAIRAAEKKAYDESKRPGLFGRWLKAAADSRKLSASFVSFRHFLRRMCIEELSAQGALSLPDAAQTAMACGAAKALAAALQRFSQIRIDLRPDFSAGHSRALIIGMFSISAGHIILAAIKGIAHYIKGGIAQWKNTRSKTS